MYNYKIGYHSYEESGYVDLSHEKQFTREELLDMVGKATVETVVRLKAKDPDSLSLHSFQDICSGDYQDDNCNLYACLRDLFGFTYIRFENTISVFGWASVFTKGDWQVERQDLDFITDHVLAAGFSEADDTHLQRQKESRKQYLANHPEVTQP